jgi:ribosomal protein L37AE/L43A
MKSTNKPRTADCDKCGAKWHGANFKGVSLCPLHAAAIEVREAAKTLVSHLHHGDKCTFCGRDEHEDAPYCPVLALEKAISSGSSQ